MSITMWCLPKGPNCWTPALGVFAWAMWKAEGPGLVAEGQEVLKRALLKSLRLTQVSQFLHSILVVRERLEEQPLFQRVLLAVLRGCSK